MCGLSAIVDFEPRPGLAQALAAMHARIPHRGPDGEGFCAVVGQARWTDAPSVAALVESAPAARAGFAFRWLQVQDRGAASAQPMASADGTVRLLFNGEIYNFRELRDELAAAGRAFRSRSDTEVVVAAYERWGAGMFERLEGMWSIVLADLRRQVLLISRDRFGIKPLFHHRDGARLVVASEVKQLLAAGARPEADLDSVARFVRGRRPDPLERTFFRSVRAVPPATYAEIDLSGPACDPVFRPYWTLGAAPRADSFEEARDALAVLIEHSVAEHMVAAVPVGLLVSGGLDSSIVAAFSAGPYARRGEKGMAYSMVPGEGARRLDERQYIDRVAARFGLEGHAAQLSAAWLKESIGRITWTQEEPVAGIAVAAQNRVFELAAAHGSRVVLDGQGADEIFGGYPRHQVAHLAHLSRNGAPGRAVLAAGAMVARDRGFARDLWKYAILPRLNRGRPRDAVDFIRPPHDTAPAAPGPASLGETLARDVVAGNLRSVLGLTDRNAMAHAIEARVPYVHRPIVEFAAGLPDEFRLGRGRRKRILRSVGERILPAGIASRSDRIGFGVPTGPWLERDFAPDLRALARGEVFGPAAAFDGGAMARFIDGFLARGHADSGTVWRLYAVDRWARAYAVTGL